MERIARSSRLAARFSFRRASRKMRAAHGTRARNQKAAGIRARDVLLKETTYLSPCPPRFPSSLFLLLFPSIDLSRFADARSVEIDRTAPARTSTC
jgi:hypothetical protein